jgi:hypothetical protein
MNIGGAYFMLHGKELYSQIFFNHQPIMAYISYFIQAVTHPVNMYALLLRHMQFMLLFGFVANFLLFRRFGIAAIGFTIIYELSKYYIFAYRFLGESYVVYAMVYLAGLLWYKYSGKKIYSVEYIIAAILSWFTVFTREPYALSVLFAYLVILGKPKDIDKRISLSLFLVLSAVIVVIQPLGEYFFSIITVSAKGTLFNEVATTHVFGAGLLNIFFYPFFVVFSNKFNDFWMLFHGLSLVFILLSLYMLFIRKKYVLMVIMYLLLGFANIRYLYLGETFYGAFHIIPWYGMMLLFLFLMLVDLFEHYKYYSFASAAIVLCFFGFYVFRPTVFFKNPPDLQRDLLVNYGEAMNIGEIVQNLSTPQQTFFIDYSTDGTSFNLSYWQSQRLSPYKYSWYIYFAPGFRRYVDAREEMFKENPPDFYYVYALDAQTKKITTEKYKTVYQDDKKTGLYIKKNIAKTLLIHEQTELKQLAITIK